MTDVAGILTCYRSGQIDETAMVEICNTWPEVKEALDATSPCAAELVEAGGCAPPIAAAPGEPEHLCWTASTTAYVRAHNAVGPIHAVLFQAAPKQTEHGKSIAMRFPVLVIPEFVDDAEATARKVAEILNKHWSKGE